MSGNPTTWNKFGPDDPISTLPQQMRACLPPNKPTPACDLLIGNAASGQPDQFCANDRFKTMTYCACVNNSVGKCPQFMAACGNSAYSYKPSYLFLEDGVTSSNHNDCNNSPFCANIVDINGDHNVISGITQQCGNISYIQSAIKSNPLLAFLAITLLIMIILVMMSGTAPTEPPLIPPSELDKL